MRNHLLLILLLPLTGCATLPTSKKVTDFADAATAGTDLLKGAVDSNRTLSIRIGEEEEADKYLNNEGFNLGDKPIAMLSAARLKPRLDALDALNKYASALKLAADQGVIDGLQQAATNLGTSVKGVATIASPATAPIAGPAISVAFRGFGVLLGNEYALEIHNIIATHDADVQAVVQLLKQDLAKFKKAIAQDVAIYERDRTIVLFSIRNDQKVNRLELYNQYKTARQDVHALKAQTAALEKYDELLTDLADAHAALANDDPNAQATLKQFTDLTSDLSALATVLK